MSYRAVAEALDTLAAGLASLGSAVIPEDRVYSPMTGVPYIRTRLSGYSRTPAGFGANSMMQETGTFQITIMRPSVEGRVRGLEIADGVVRAFARGTGANLATGQKLWIEYASAQPAQIEADWIMFPVVVTWFASDP